MSREISFFIEGRFISIERYEEETDASFAERSSFMLFFRNDPIKYQKARAVSFHHTNKIFKGTTYKAEIEAEISALRSEIRQIKTGEA